MKKVQFYILDVFAEEKYAGNQLAVVRDCSGLTDKQMLKITREMNYSETTFIMLEKEREGGFDVRIFTPGGEVPFAGHPTLGTAYLIQREIISKEVKTVKLNLKVGQIEVAFNYDGDKPGILWMKQIQPTFGAKVESRKIAEVIGINESDIDERFPIQEVSTGLPFIIVPLKSLDAVKRARVNTNKFFELVKNRQAKTILVFCPQTYHKENDLNVRVFCDYYGIPEDPATGSGNGCLAGYLAKYKYFGSGKVDVRVEQGYEINRRSLLRLKSQDNDGKIDIFVGGKVIMTAAGELI
jgi:trans-2,3-dihydro-3-hydroxyanthranilate isomerase